MNEILRAVRVFFFVFAGLAPVLYPVHAVGFQGGAGTPEDPFRVATAAHLDQVRNHPAAHYLQTADIELDVAPWNGGAGWTPIGSVSPDEPFTGTYDGDGFVIRGLAISRPGGLHQGLFGYVRDATLRNLDLQDITLQTGGVSGGLAGLAQTSRAQHVSVMGHIVADGDRSGGLIGELRGGVVFRCETDIILEGAWDVGGLAGYVTAGARIGASSSDGAVQGGRRVGGLIGQVHFAQSPVIADSYSRAAVEGEYIYGGLVGLADRAGIFRCYSTGAVTPWVDPGDGLPMGGFAGFASGAVRDCYWDVQTSGFFRSGSGLAAEGRTTLEMRQPETFVHFNFTTLWDIDAGVSHPVHRDLRFHAPPQPLTLADLAGSGTAADPYLVTHADELNAVRLGLDKHFRMTHDIDMSATVVWDEGRGWSGIGASPTAQRFSGRFDGGGHALLNLVINRPATLGQGLFAYTRNARIFDLQLTAASLLTGGNSGALVGQADLSELEDVSVTGSVLLGQASYNEMLGALAGRLSGGFLDRGFAVAPVQGQAQVGGLVGVLDGDAQIRNAYAHGSVRGTSEVGGLVGLAAPGGLFRCYSIGRVVGTGPHVGGFAGLSSGNVLNGYWDIETSGMTQSSGGVGYPTIDMLRQATYQNFDFTSIWAILEDTTYPFLRDADGGVGPAPVNLSDLEGDGTADHPYIITHVDELHAMRQGLDRHYRLGNDIDMHIARLWDSGRGWTPIGAFTLADRFTGSLDGDGFTISNLFFLRPGVAYGGLFGFAENASFRNLNLAEVHVQPGPYGGALVGQANDSVIENVVLDGLVASTDPDVGGLVGYLFRSRIHNVYADVTVQGARHTGGLVGYVTQASEIRHVRTYGSVQGATHVGGLIGAMDAQSFVADSYSRSTVDGDDHLGGLAGLVQSAGLYRTYSTGTVNDRKVEGDGFRVGGLVGFGSGNFLDCYWNMETSGLTNSAAGTGYSNLVMRSQSAGAYETFNFNTLWTIDEGNDHPVFRDLSLYALPAAVALDDLDGNGTPANPYRIGTAAELNAMHLGPDRHYRLTNDVDLTDSVIWNAGSGWMPVGVLAAGPAFSGGLDGDGFAIRFLSLNRPQTFYQGMFGFAENAIIRNLRIEAPNLLAGQLAGGLVGLGVNATLEFISIQDGIVLSPALAIGALVGYADQCILDVIRADGGITWGAGYVGGIAGYVDGGLLHRLSSDTLTRGPQIAGGLIGYFANGGEMRHSFATGRVEDGMARPRESIGGLVGDMRGGALMSDVYSLATVVSSNVVGGLVGFVSGGTIYRAYSAGWVDAAGDGVGGFLGVAQGGAFRDCHWDRTTSGMFFSAGSPAVQGHATAAMQTRATFETFNFQSLWQIDEGNGYPVFRDLDAYPPPGELDPAGLAGSGIAADPYIVTDLQELYALRRAPGAHYRLGNTIDMSAAVVWDRGRGWRPLGDADIRFAGTLDGDGHVLMNLAINRPGAQHQGLFGYAEGADIRNFRLAGINLQAGDYAGGLAGRADDARIEHVYVDGLLLADGHTAVGGVAGRFSKGSIERVSTDVEVLGGLYAGGVLGYFSGGSAEAPARLNRAAARGVVRGTSRVGGLAGYMTSFALVTNAFSRAAVTAQDHVGGLVGQVVGEAAVRRAYSTGLVTGGLANTHVGGLVGRDGSGNITDSYWDTATSFQSGSAGGAPRNTVAMTDPHALDTYVDWDFTAIWSADLDGAANDGYPFLQGFALPHVLRYLAGPGGLLQVGATLQNSFLLTVADGDSGPEVVAVPDSGAEFHLWSDGVPTEARTDTDVDGDQTVSAGFQSLAGVPIEWFERFGLAPDWDAGEDWSDLDDRDDDLDGVSNAAEFVADTDPTDAASYLYIRALDFGNPPAIRVWFEHSSTERVYTLLYSDDLADGVWNAVPGEGPRFGAGGVDSFEDPDTAPMRFYRIRVTLP